MPRVENRNASLYYEQMGHGPDLVLAHGAGGNTLSWWQQVPFFRQRFRVTNFDHRLFGRSHCEAEDFRPEWFASDLLAILDDAGVEHAAIVCQSMGGWTGLRAAIEHPERVSCLVLCGTSGGLLTRRILNAAARVGHRTREEGIVANAAVAMDFAMREPARADLYHRISELNEHFAQELLVRLYEPAARITPEQLEAFRVPVLLIAGEYDPLFPPDALEEVAEMIPGAELLLCPGVGHSPYFEAPDPFNEIVAEFLDKHCG